MKNVVLFVIFLSVATCIGSAQSLEFPESCRAPAGVVEEVYGVDTEKATMAGRRSMPDLIYACHVGYIHQGTMEISECTEFLVEEGYLEEKLNAQANCMKGAITVNGNLTVFPVAPSCANGGFQAIRAFKILCPSADLRLEE